MAPLWGRWEALTGGATLGPAGPGGIIRLSAEPSQSPVLSRPKSGIGSADKGKAIAVPFGLENPSQAIGLACSRVTACAAALREPKSTARCCASVTGLQLGSRRRRSWCSHRESRQGPQSAARLPQRGPIWVLASLRDAKREPADGLSPPGIHAPTSVSPEAIPKGPEFVCAARRAKRAHMGS